MHTLRTAGTGGLTLAAALLLAGPAHAEHTGDRNCADFDSQAAAQAHYREHPGDPDDLDRNDNDVACEDNAGYPDPARDEAPLQNETPGEGEGEMVMPEGGVDAGGGGTAGPENTGLIAAGGIALTVGAGGMILAARRNRA